MENPGTSRSFRPLEHWGKTKQSTNPHTKEKKKEERKGERKRPNRRKRQIHLAPSLRQMHVSAEASPTRKEENKATIRKERNRVSSKYTYQERAGQEKKKRTSLQNTSPASHLFRLKISPMSRLNKHQLLLKISLAHLLLVHFNHFSSQYSTSMPNAVHRHNNSNHSWLWLVDVTKWVALVELKQ